MAEFDPLPPLTRRRGLRILPQLCWGRWPGRAGWGAAGPAAGMGFRYDGRASRVGGQRNGATTALSSVLAQVRPRPAPQHDASRDDALAGLAQSSARWPRLSETNSDRALFRRLRLPSAQAHCRSRRPHAREFGREGRRRRARRMASLHGISRVAIRGRFDRRRITHRHRAEFAPRSGSRSRNLVREAGRLLDPQTLIRGAGWSAADRKIGCALTRRSRQRREVGAVGHTPSGLRPPSPAELGKEGRGDLRCVNLVAHKGEEATRQAPSVAAGNHERYESRRRDGEGRLKRAPHPSIFSLSPALPLTQ